MRLLLFLLPFLLISTGSGAEEVWTLQDLIKYATRNSPYLLEATKDIEIANLDEDIAWQNRVFGFSLNLEALSGVAGGQRRLVSGGGVVISNTIGGTNVIVPFFTAHLDYPLLKEGRFISQRSIPEDIARVNYNETQESYLMRKADVISSISDLFLQIALKKKEIEYLKQNEARLKTIVEQSKKRFESKLITQSDFLEAQLRLTDIQTNIRVAGMDLDVLKKQLANLIGMPLDQNPPDVDGDVSTFENVSSLIPSLNDLKPLALEQNPRLSVANMDVEKSQLNLKLVQKRIYPILSLTSAAAVNTSLESSEFGGLSLRFPIDELFRRFLTKDPELLKMRVAVEKSRINLELVQNSVELELIQDYTNWSKAKEFAMSAWNRVKVEETRVNEGQMRSKEGLITVGEYMGYINSYQEAYNEFEVRKREEYNALLTLLRNAGVVDRFLVR